MRCSRQNYIWSLYFYIDIIYEYIIYVRVCVNVSCFMLCDDWSRCFGVSEPEPLVLLVLKPATLLYTGELHAGEQDDSRKAACHGIFQWMQRLWANHTPVATGHFFSGSFSPSSEPPITDAPSSCWDLKL